ncbi:hypothetical protein SNEBB_002982 [Seison nebaliae]|nr:hypothetical protein SNEBB_002982 [Seison nebaliae]
MSIVKAAGFLLFRRVNKNIEYLIMRASYGEHHWSPPKGHTEKGETQMEAAKREFNEETGIKFEGNVKIYDEMKYDLNYNVKDEPKHVDYYVGELLNNLTVKISDEHDEFKWIQYSTEMLQLLKYPDMCEMMKNVDEKLKKEILKL